MLSKFPRKSHGHEILHFAILVSHFSLDISGIEEKFRKINYLVLVIRSLYCDSVCSLYYTLLVSEWNIICTTM